MPPLHSETMGVPRGRPFFMPEFLLAMQCSIRLNATSTGNGKQARHWLGRNRTKKTKPITYVPNNRSKRTFTIYAAESKPAS